jgi:hypothetical protein
VKSDNRLVIAIFAILVTMLAAPFIHNIVRDARRPKLVGVRIVTATDGDPVFRTGARHLGPQDELRIAVALELEQSGNHQWLAPVERLEIDGRELEHQQASEWPEKDRTARVFWFTVEGANVGGEVKPGDAAKRLRYGNFLAPEMGRGLLARAPPDVHNDDALGPQFEGLPVDGGTHRFYARVDIIEPESSEVTAVQTAATRGPQQVLEPDFPAVHRSMTVPEGIDPTVGELFNLGGWEVEGDRPELLDRAARGAFNRSFEELVQLRVVTSSRTFAAVALTGSPSLPDAELDDVAELVINVGTATRAGRPVRWGVDILPGDCLVDDGHFTVVMTDDGNGVLDVNDDVIHCWKRPPARHTFGTVFPEESIRVRQVRRGD